MKIAVLGPIGTADITRFLDAPVPEGFPVGYVGAPFMASLINELLARGHEVVAVTSGGFAPGPGIVPKVLRGQRFTFYCCPARQHSVRWAHGYPGRILDFFAVERRIMRDVLAAEMPDVVHAHWQYEYGMVAIASGRPHLVTAHDDPVAVLRLMGGAYRLGRLFMAWYVLRRAAMLSAVSDSLGLRLGRFTKTSIETVPNPLDLRFMSQQSARHIGTGGEEIRFLSVFNGWGKLKNAEAALKAFALVRQQFPQATYHLFGASYEPDGVAARWARSTGCAEGVVFHGPVPHSQLAEEVRKAALLLHPSRWEECPMGIAESMAQGLPAIGGRKSGGVPWMIGNGGRVVDVGNPQEIANAAIELVGNPEFYENCSVQARKRVEAFRPATVVDQYEALYQKAIQTSSGSVS